MTPTERARRAAGLDGLRGLAALCVFLVHIWIYTKPARPPREEFWDFLLWELRVTVVFFFVLSGFLLFRDFARAVVRRDGPADVGGYAKRRVARIVPAYYVALAGAVLLLWGAADVEGFRPISEGELALFALFSQDYSSETLLRFNPVLWTLGLEVAFYIALPFLGALAYRLGSARRTVWMLVAISVLGLGWNAAVHWGDLGKVAAYALPGYLPYFALGMLLSLWLEWSVATRGERPAFGAVATALAVAGGFALVAANGVWHATAVEVASDAWIGVFQDLPSAFGFALIIGAAAFGRGPGVAWSRFRPIVYTGIVSYGFYLWHVPVILFVKRLGLLPESFLPAVLVTLPVAIGIASISWFAMERPVLRWAARVTRPREPARRRTRFEARTVP